MNSRLLLVTAAIAIAGATSNVSRADDQTPSEPAGTRYAPAPTVAEELVYLRDIIALQTLRLDEAEEKIARQDQVIQTQQMRIDTLERAYAAAGQGGQSFAAMGGVHVVRGGDTLYSIARRYGSNVNALATANNLRAPYSLSVGQRIAVPGLAPAAPPAPIEEPKETPAPQPAVIAEAPPAHETAASSAAPSEAAPQRVASGPAGPTPEERPDVTERAIEAQRKQEQEQPDGALPTEVGVRPEEEEEKPYLAIFSDVGGILTPKGSFYIEPGSEFTVTSDNRFFFQGVEILDAVLIGAIEASDSDRRAVTESLGFRYGLTSRLEIDGRVPFIARKDRITGVVIDEDTATLRELTGYGLGDVEMGLHYQLNRGLRFPYAIANVRAKAPTGIGPFDLPRNASGVELELATGSGYWTIEPSLTLILPSDPAVFFANVGYQVNLMTTPDAIVGTSIIREYDPGDAVRASLGVGLSVNERASINFGYDSRYFFKTHTLVDRAGVLTDLAQPTAVVGSFIFGASYAVNDDLRLNLNAAFGATDEAPDMRISLRAQIRIFD